MRKFLQVLTLLSLFFSVSYAIEFRDVKIITLKKDEQKKILVKYDSIEKLFKFRWTLYKNRGLVIFKSYDKVVSQNILYMREKNQIFKLELMPRGRDFNLPYLLVKFKKFDFENNIATFEIFLYDKNMKINLKDI